MFEKCFLLEFDFIFKVFCSLKTIFESLGRGNFIAFENDIFVHRGQKNSFSTKYAFFLEFLSYLQQSKHKSRHDVTNITVITKTDLIHEFHEQET